MSVIERVCYPGEQTLERRFSMMMIVMCRSRLDLYLGGGVYLGERE